MSNSRIRGYKVRGDSFKEISDASFFIFILFFKSDSDWDAQPEEVCKQIQSYILGGI